MRVRAPLLALHRTGLLKARFRADITGACAWRLAPGCRTCDLSRPWHLSAGTHDAAVAPPLTGELERGVGALDAPLSRGDDAELLRRREREGVRDRHADVGEPPAVVGRGAGDLLGERAPGCTSAEGAGYPDGGAADGRPENTGRTVEVTPPGRWPGGPGRRSPSDASGPLQGHHGSRRRSRTPSATAPARRGRRPGGGCAELSAGGSCSSYPSRAHERAPDTAAPALPPQARPCSKA